MIEEHKQGALSRKRRLWLGLFVLLLVGTIFVVQLPAASANAFSFLTDGFASVFSGAPERVDASRILSPGAESGEADMILGADKKVTIRRGETEMYATSRAGERVSELLQREGISVEAPELVRVEIMGDEVLLEIAANFTFYETVQEPTEYETVYTTDYTLPKGEMKVVQPGQDGVCDVTYEIIYADGAFVSRQAVAQENDTAVVEIVSTGTMVRDAREGDTIDQVVFLDDGSGYLLLKSGDSLHFTHTMEVKCTAYTTGYDGVGTITYTGTTVHTGVVAVDKSVIPLGSRMFITTKSGDFTYGMAHAEDTGVFGKVVDLYMNTYNECIQFGRRSSILYFLDP